MLDGVTLNFNGSKIIIHLSGNKRGLLVGNSNTLNNLDVEIGSTSSGANGNYHCPILIGDSLTGVGKRDIKIYNVVVKSNRLNANLIGIFGNSHDITLDGVDVSDNLVAGRGIMIHWGNISNYLARTTHPCNIFIKNITGNNLAYKAVVFISGAHNIAVENVNGSGVMVYAGDYVLNMLTFSLNILQ